MDSHQRQKTLRALLESAKEPEIASMVRELFCPPPNPADDLAKKKKERNGRVLDWFALFLAFAGWWYSVLAPNPNVWFGSLLLLGAIGAALLAVWGFFLSWRRKGRILSGIVAVLLFIGMEYGWYLQRSIIAKDHLVKSQTDQRNQVQRSLSAHMEYDLGDSPTESVFAYENDSDSGIVVDRISAIIRTLRFGRGGVAKGEILDSHLIIKQDSEWIVPGGDGQSTPFLERFNRSMGFHDAKGLLPLICADMIMEIDYHLESQPANKQFKQFRFATRPEKDGVKWFKVAILPTATDYCNDSVFQKR